MGENMTNLRALSKILGEPFVIKKLIPLMSEHIFCDECPMKSRCAKEVRQTCIEVWDEWLDEETVEKQQ